MNFVCLLAAIVSFMLIENVVAQSQQISVQGQVVDEQTGEPLPYASLYIRERSIGTVANEKGDFLLRIDHPKDTDSLFLSLLGYQTKRIALVQLVGQSYRLKLGLRQAAKQLQEVVVRPVDAVQLVTQAVQRIPYNYPDRPSLLTGFYREWVREQDFLLLSEGVLEVYKASYRKGAESDAVRLIKGRRKPLPNYFLASGDTCRMPDITNGPHLGILLDLAKPGQMSNFLSSIGPEIYDYTYVGVTSIHDRDTYEILFVPNLKVAWRSVAFFVGKLFVDKSSLAIVQAEYDLSTIGCYEFNRQLNIGRSSLRVVKRHYLVKYQPHEGRYVLHHVQVDNEYRHTSKTAKPITNRMDFVVTKTMFDNVQKPSRKAIIGLNQSFSEQVMPFDSAFWVNDIILQPR